MSTFAPPGRSQATRAWSEELLDELASQLAAHPRIEALVQERVAEAIAHREPRRAWLTLTEAAELLGCSPNAVRMRVNRGRLESRRHGRRVYVSVASIDRLGRAA
jgi:excisionase family DNA binding protein